MVRQTPILEIDTEIYHLDWSLDLRDQSQRSISELQGPILETNLCIHLRDQSLYPSKRSISVFLPEIDLREIDLSIDLKINLVLILEIDTEINSEIYCWGTKETLISDYSSEYYCYLSARSTLRNGTVG